MGAFSNLNKNSLSLKLKAIPIKELIITSVAFGDIYRFENEMFELTFRKGRPINNTRLKELHDAGFYELFMEDMDYLKLQEVITEKLIKSTRSLSIGDPVTNGRKQLGLLSLNMDSLYKNPMEDNLLDVQFKGSQNLSKFLLEHKGLHSKLYQDVKKFNPHFVIAQPFLSSLLTLGFLQYLQQFQDTDLEQLFLTSFFKDIGMSFIPEEHYDKVQLDESEKKAFTDHAEFSKQLLDGRVSISRNYLEVIENHHYLNDKIALIKAGLKVSNIDQSEKITGIETLVISVMDIIAAMIEGRPYAQKESLFNTLDLIKKLISKEYSYEFRALVLYLRKFFG